jgi:hypothetical protein
MSAISNAKLFRQVTRTLTNEEIKVSTNYILLPPPPTGSYYIPIMGAVHSNIVTAYTGLSNEDYLYFSHEGEQPPALIYLPRIDAISETSLTDLYAASKLFVLPVRTGKQDNNWGPTPDAGFSTFTPKPFHIGIQYNSSPLAGGHKDNTLTVSMIYTTYRTRDGRFV